MQERVGNVRRKMEILRKNQKEMLKIKKKKNATPSQSWKMPLTGFLANWTRWGKTLWVWGYENNNFLKWRAKRRRKIKKKFKKTPEDSRPVRGEATREGRERGRERSKIWSCHDRTLEVWPSRTSGLAVQPQETRQDSVGEIINRPI